MVRFVGHEDAPEAVCGLGRGLEDALEGELGEALTEKHRQTYMFNFILSCSQPRIVG